MAKEFAVIKTGGKQYKVSKGDTIKIEKLPKAHKKGAKVAFDKVLLYDDGKTTKVGAPFLDKAKVTGTFEGEGKAKKINVVKYKAKSRYNKTRGHRQIFNKVKIDSLK
ncbi:MAG: 50S ribosomal protein L21 [Candidatus Paceibacteria bacterium]